MVYRGAGVNSFLYTEEAIEEIETSLSCERLGTYLDAAGDDRERAIRFHAWNTAVSAAFYGPLRGWRWPCAMPCIANSPSGTARHGTTTRIPGSAHG